MQIRIQLTQIEDIPAIFRLYDDAIAYQKQVGNNHWLGFQPSMVEQEIVGRRHFKILGDEEIISTFCITLSDPLIWKDGDVAAAVYIHRIATGHQARGNNLLKHIIHWAKAFGKENHLQYVRIDTGSGNDRLIGYYIRNGFTFLGDFKVNYTPDLPEHYKNGMFALLEMPV